MTPASEARGEPTDRGPVRAVRAVVARTGEVRSASGMPTVSPPEPDPAAERRDLAVVLVPVPEGLEPAEVPDFVDVDELSDELDELLALDDESPVSASADGADARATPTPRVTAKAPTRPMCLA
ncbi:MAG: hypothetical protein HY997_11630 [Mycolicibacterium neoaurum]|nr:hypothetical protein [Mycolicibacterium neoaurum]